MTRPEMAGPDEVHPASWCLVERLVDVVEVFGAGIQVCAWQRQADPRLGRWLSSLDERVGASILEILKPDQRPELAALPSPRERSLLADDLALQGSVLCDLLGCPAYGVRIVRTRDAMCPGWHVDRVSLRVVCTYWGPGTQWLADQSVDRGALRDRSTEGADFVCGAVGDVVLLKGARWPGNEHLGAIHRSPDVPAAVGARTVATLDPLWLD